MINHLKGLTTVFIFLFIIFISSCKPAAQEDMQNVLSFAPDFQLPDIQKNTVTLSNYRNKQPVILFFWTTWCPFCRGELKSVNDMYAGLVKDGFEVLAINVGEHAFKVENFIKNYRLTYRVLLDQDTNVAEKYELLGVPTYVLVDKQGYIRFQGNSFPKDKHKNLITD